MAATKSALLTFRVLPATRKAVEAAAQRDRRSVSNFIEGAVLAALPADLRGQWEAETGLSPAPSQGSAP